MSETEIGSITEKDAMTEAEFIVKRDELLMNWDKLKAQLAAAKEEEMAQRKAIVAFLFNKDKLTGTENHELGNGYKVKSVKKLNYSVNQETVNACLDEIENLDERGKFIAERLIKWSADLSVTEYKELEPKYKTIIDKCVTTSEGAPSLEIVEPKDKKKL